MEINELPQFDPNVDYREILPIHQKRTVTFINHFITNTVSFLNKFADSCESKLLSFEYKLQKVEASLLILESQLSSIPEIDDTNNEKKEVIVLSEDVLDLPPILSEEIEVIQDKVVIETIEDNDHPKAVNDPRFSKFFKMVQFGVPAQAVKLKMIAEGANPEVLDNQHAIIPGYNPLDFKNVINDISSDSA